MTLFLCINPIWDWAILQTAWLLIRQLTHDLPPKSLKHSEDHHQVSSLISYNAICKIATETPDL